MEDKKTTIRISESSHSLLLKIQGQIQMESGKYTSMDDTITLLIENYKKRK